jgi:transcriptional regulator with XRE-family HTH domain
MKREPELIEEFGRYVREWRERQNLGLREVARKADISPTYLSQIERGEQRWPTEDVLMRLANAVAHDPSELLHKAGRVSSDVLEILKIHPSQYTRFLEETKNLDADDLDKVVRHALLDIRRIIQQRQEKKWFNKNPRG